MAITNAVQRGNAVYVYNEKKQNIFTKPGELHGFTSSTVVVRRGNFLTTYNEKGQDVGTTPG